MGASWPVDCCGCCWCCCCCPALACAGSAKPVDPPSCERGLGGGTRRRLLWGHWWWRLAPRCWWWLLNCWCLRGCWLDRWYCGRWGAELRHLASDERGGLAGLVPRLLAVVAWREGGGAVWVVAERAHPSDWHSVACTCAIVHQGWLAMFPDQGRRSVVGGTTASFAATARPFA